MRSIYVGPWRIDVIRRDRLERLLPDTVLARSIAAALQAGGAPAPASVGLTLTDDAELAILNAAHMGEPGPTDVLSFPILPPDAFPDHPGKAVAGGSGLSFPLPPGGRQPIGDIVVSVQRAVAQAEAGRGGQTGDVRWSAADELRLLVTHGTLHLCGWDHADPVEEAAMRALEQRLLAGGRRDGRRRPALATLRPGGSASWGSRRGRAHRRSRPAPPGRRDRNRRRGGG